MTLPRIHIDEEDEHLIDDMNSEDFCPDVRYTKDSDVCGRGGKFIASYHEHLKDYGPGGLVTVWVEHPHIQAEIEHFERELTSFAPDDVEKAVIHSFGIRAAQIVFHTNILCRLRKYSKKTTKELQSSAALTTALLSVSLGRDEVLRHLAN